MPIGVVYTLTRVFPSFSYWFVASWCQLGWYLQMWVTSIVTSMDTHPTVEFLYLFWLRSIWCRISSLAVQNGYTALIHAANEGYTSVATLLLDAKADINRASNVRLFLHSSCHFLFMNVWGRCCRHWYFLFLIVHRRQIDELIQFENMCIMFDYQWWDWFALDCPLFCTDPDWYDSSHGSC